MKFQIYRDKKYNKRRITLTIISITILLTGIFLYRSYALYQNYQNFSVISGNVSEFIDAYDVKLALTIDGVAAKDIPNKNSNKTVDSIICDKDAKGFWDYENWRLFVDFKNSRTKCQINFVTKYTEKILNGTDPVLKEGLIPVTIGNNGEVRKANLSSEWYSYTKKVWANAVILFDESKIYQEGEIIPEENIESYFVWIPRYRYIIVNDGIYEGLLTQFNTKFTFPVTFETKEIEASSNNQSGKWLTHPAFTSFDVNGIWVGKFETGYQNARTTSEAQINAAYASKIQIKPNVYSWREMIVANAFTASYDYKREMDSHMMKNTEWGAVAILHHSDYGSQASVRINNNAAYLTGYAAKNEPTCGHTGNNEACNVYESTEAGVDGVNTYNYKNSLSVVASTTGNYSGIYDMSGGAFEYVMGVMADSTGTPVSGADNSNNSNFNGLLSLASYGKSDKVNWTSSNGGIPFPDAKYYDVYAYGEDSVHYNRRILGDATGEMGTFVSYENNQISSWYGDEAWFVNYKSPWFIRGRSFSFGTSSGIFSFFATTGQKHKDGSFRVVLAF